MNGLTFKEAFNKAQPGQYIKALGDRFDSNAGYHFKDINGQLVWTNGGAGFTYTPEQLQKMLDNTSFKIYGVYKATREYTKIYPEETY